MTLQIDWVAYVRMTQPDPESTTAYDWARDLRDNLRRESLGVIADVAMHLSTGHLRTALPDYNADQLMLKLSFMNESAKFRRTSNGFLLVDSTLGQHWFVHSGDDKDTLVMDQVL